MPVFVGWRNFIERTIVLKVEIIQALLSDCVLSIRRLL